MNGANHRLLAITWTWSIAAFFCANALEGQAQDTTTVVPLEAIVVPAGVVGELGLEQVTNSASRLGLSVLETPASIGVLHGSMMKARGYTKVSDAVESLPGVVAGSHPTAPSMLSMRGFTRGQITVLRDGVWIGPSGMVMRPQNTFNLDRIEVLMGPSSALNGQGSVAGTVNTVSKSASTNLPASTEAMLEYGSYNTYHLGAGAGRGIGRSLAYRADLSRYGTDGYVERMDQMSTNATASILWQPAEAASFKVSADYLRDDVGGYFGTPLVPLSAAREPMTGAVSTDRGETLDRAMRFVNYNIEDAKAASDQWFLRNDVELRLSDNVRLTNTLYRFNADREWKNAEGYVFCTGVVDVCIEPGTVQRYYGYFVLSHDQDLWGNRLVANFDHTFAGRRHRVVVGGELLGLDFVRRRGFRQSVPLSPGDAVDPLDPTPGVYGEEELRGISPTGIDTRAVFIEDAFELTGRLSVLAAVRYERLDLDRKNFNASGEPEGNGFTREYSWWSWRLGTVLGLSDNVTVYGQYSNAKDPINSNVFLVNADQNFDLTDAVQWEVGAKALLFDGRAEATFAYYDIARDDILERFALDNATNVGGRDARGVEISTVIQPFRPWRVGVNAAFTDASFKRSANFEALAGNTPPNVPPWTANVWTNYSIPWPRPVDLSASIRHVGERFGDNTNSVRLKAYTLVGASAKVTVGQARFSVGVDNAFDRAFVPWSEKFYLHQDDPSFLYANQLMIGPPRTYWMRVEIL